MATAPPAPPAPTAPPVASLAVDAQDVIRLILQFLKENGLTDSMLELQMESGVALNTVDDVEAFLSDIRYGRWDAVLQQVAGLKIPSEKLSALYEQVLLELLETGERDLCKELLASAEPLLLFKVTQPERYSRLDVFCKRPFFNASDAYEMGQTKDSRRQELVTMLREEVAAVSPSRLLSLLGDAVRFHSAAGPLPQPFDLFRGQRRAQRKDLEERVAKHFAAPVTHTHSGEAVSALAWSPEGDACVLGCSRGALEVWDGEVQALRADLAHQATAPPSMGAAVLCAAMSKDGDHCALGCADGSVRVVRVSTGASVRTFAQAHSAAVGCVAFSRDHSQVLSGSQDLTARIHGLRSGKTLKEFRGHASYVNAAIFTKDSLGNVLTGSADGSVRLWDSRTTECLYTYRPGARLGHEHAVLAVLPAARPDHYVVCSRSNTVHVISAAGQEVAAMTTGKAQGGEIVAACTSPQGRYLYAAGEDGNVYVFDLKLGQLEEVVDSNLPGQRAVEAVLLTHHPHRNLAALVTREGHVRLLTA